MKDRRIETVIHFEINSQISSRWYADLLDLEPTKGVMLGQRA